VRTVGPGLQRPTSPNCSSSDGLIIVDFVAAADSTGLRQLFTCIVT